MVEGIRRILQISRNSGSHIDVLLPLVSPNPLASPHRHWRSDTKTHRIAVSYVLALQPKGPFK